MPTSVIALHKHSARAMRYSTGFSVTRKRNHIYGAHHCCGMPLHYNRTDPSAVLGSTWQVLWGANNCHQPCMANSRPSTSQPKVRPEPRQRSKLLKNWVNTNWSRPGTDIEFIHSHSVIPWSTTQRQSAVSAVSYIQLRKFTNFPKIIVIKYF